MPVHTMMPPMMSHAMMVKKCMEMNPGMTLPQASKKVAADRKKMMKKKK